MTHRRGIGPGAASRFRFMTKPKFFTCGSEKTMRYILRVAEQMRKPADAAAEGRAVGRAKFPDLDLRTHHDVCGREFGAAPTC
jgi:hypothetical protein